LLGETGSVPGEVFEFVKSNHAVEEQGCPLETPGTPGP
jgi:hypothetical protein